jgi:hypothetical protein
MRDLALSDSSACRRANLDIGYCARQIRERSDIGSDKSVPRIVFERSWTQANGGLLDEHHLDRASFRGVVIHIRRGYKRNRSHNPVRAFAEDLLN